MLTVNPFESLVAARLLEFFDIRTPWHRRLWATGLTLTLRETLESSDMVAAKVLYQNSVKALADTAVVLAGTDPGVISGDPGIGTPAYKKKLHKLLLTDLLTGSIQYLELAQVMSDLESRYLRNWSAALQANAAGTVTLKAERTARAIASTYLIAGSPRSSCSDGSAMPSITTRRRKAFPRSSQKHIPSFKVRRKSLRSWSRSESSLRTNPVHLRAGFKPPK